MNGVPSSLLCCCAGDSKPPEIKCEQIWRDCPEYLYISFTPSIVQYTRKICQSPDGTDYAFSGGECDEDPGCENLLTFCSTVPGQILESYYSSVSFSSLKFKKKIWYPEAGPIYQRVTYEAVQGPEQTGTASVYSLSNLFTNTKGTYPCGEACTYTKIQEIKVDSPALSLKKVPGEQFGGRVEGSFVTWTTLTSTEVCYGHLAMRVGGFYENIVTTTIWSDLPNGGDACQQQYSETGICVFDICDPSFGNGGFDMTYEHTTKPRLKSLPPLCPAVWFMEPFQQARIFANGPPGIPFTGENFPFGPCPPLYDYGDGQHESSSYLLGGISNISTVP